MPGFAANWTQRKIIENKDEIKNFRPKQTEFARINRTKIMRAHNMSAESNPIRMDDESA